MGQTNLKDILNNLLNQTITLKIKDILGTLQALAKILSKKKSALDKWAKTLKTKVKSIEVKTLYIYAQLPSKIIIRICGDKSIQALINTKAEINLIIHFIAEKNGLLI